VFSCAISCAGFRYKCHKTELLFAPHDNNSNVMFCNLEGDPTTLSQNIGNQSPSDGAPCPTGKEISTATLPKPKTSHNVYVLSSYL
jgi:hypothetical protein